MSSSDLCDELKCSICLSIYTYPVYLRCGHYFCRSCIVMALDSQVGSGGYSCPDCRATYPERPTLEENRKLENIVGYFISSQSDLEETRIFCSYCTMFPVPAVKSCLQCKNSLCDNHLTVHNKTMNHILAEPTDSFDKLKCSKHQEVLEYYCLQDRAYLCASCFLVEEHRGHQVEHLDEASEEKKLKKYLEDLTSHKTETHTRIQNLLKHKTNIQEKASNMKKKINKLFMDSKKQLGTFEKIALSEIYRQEKKTVSHIKYEIRTLCRKMFHMEEMSQIPDSVRQESDFKVYNNGNCDLDDVLILVTLYRSLRYIVTNVPSQLGFHVPDIVLDVDTAHRKVKISDNLKTVTFSNPDQTRPESSGRFLRYPQVLSRCVFSSGRQYWTVECNRLRRFGIGVSYPSIKREGQQSFVAFNDKSWCLFLSDTNCVAVHNSSYRIINAKLTSKTFGVFLDYEAGRLSFYELCDLIRHLHTFTVSFTEPLHVVFYIGEETFITIPS